MSIINLKDYTLKTPSSSVFFKIFLGIKLFIIILIDFQSKI